jgi:predicted dehydrogenase
MRVAVLSFAHQRAETYARLLRDMPGVDPVIADPDGPPGDPARGRAAADRLGVPYADDWAEVFASGPRAVVVTSEVARRRELVERAAAAGAHVLCEHPLAPGEDDARAMVDACARAGVRLTLASPHCFSPAFAAVRGGIADGAVGTLTTVHGSYHSRPATGADADVLVTNAAFLLDLVDAVLDGEPAEQVYAQANGVLSGRPEVGSAALVTVRYPGGTVAAIDCGWSLSAAEGPDVTFVGDRASLRYDALPRLLGGFDAATAGERWEPGGADLYPVMLAHFVAAVDSGRADGPDGAAGLRTLRVVRSARESMRTGQPVRLR